MKVSKQHRNIITYVTIALVVLGLATYSAYQRGYIQGQKDESAKKSQSPITNDTFKYTSDFFKLSVSGKITKLDKESITITQSDGRERRFTTNNKTTVLQKDKKLSLSDLEKDQTVTVRINEINRTLANQITIK